MIVLTLREALGGYVGGIGGVEWLRDEAAGLIEVEPDALRVCETCADIMAGKVSTGELDQLIGELL